MRSSSTRTRTRSSPSTRRPGPRTRWTTSTVTRCSATTPRTSGSRCRPLKLSMLLEHTQGASIADGAIWISTSDAHNDIYRVNMKTGHVDLVAQITDPPGEGEGTRGGAAAVGIPPRHGARSRHDQGLGRALLPTDGLEVGASSLSDRAVCALDRTETPSCARHGSASSVSGVRDRRRFGRAAARVFVPLRLPPGRALLPRRVHDTSRWATSISRRLPCWSPGSIRVALGTPCSGSA